MVISSSRTFENHLFSLEHLLTLLIYLANFPCGVLHWKTSCGNDCRSCTGGVEINQAYTEFTYKVIAFIEHLLCFRHCPGPWEYSNE